MTIRTDYIVWVDLETTGSDSDVCDIIEVGAVITDAKLNTLTEFSRVVTCSEEGIERILANDIVCKMHTNSGLLEELTQGATSSIARVDQDFVDWLSDTVKNRKDHVPLGGSGVSHFDRRFIHKQMPLADRRLSYWAYDVGVLRRTFKLAGLPWINSEDTKTHRGLDDIKGHVEEMQFAMNILGEWQEMTKYLLTGVPSVLEV